MADAFSADGGSNGGNGSYSRESFYTASRNKKGFGSTVRITVPPEVISELGAVVASRQLPDYRTTPDFFRDAIVHRLHDVQEMLGSGEKIRISKLAKMLMAAEAAEKHLIMIEGRKRIIDAYRNALNLAAPSERVFIRGEIDALISSTEDDNLRVELQRLLAFI